jgi:putative phage-type endonuclease
MKIVGELKQNTPKWHQFRSEGIGASEANIIMGASKFKTPRELWLDKVYGKRKEEKEYNFITEKGHKMESKARPLFEMEMDADFPDTIVIHDEYPILRASLDGYNEDLNAVWECKFVGQDDFEKVSNGEVLEQYFPQLQHQLMVTGANINYLYVIADDKEKKEAGSSFPYKTACLEVYPDEDYISKRLLPELEKFWTMVKDKKEPKMTDRDTYIIEDNPELAGYLEQYKAQKIIADEAKKSIADLEKKIFAIADHARNIFGDIKITKTKSEDKIIPDYEALIASKHMTKEMVIEQGFSKVQKGRVTKRITFPKVSND